jgi:hypothetical protein
MHGIILIGVSLEDSEATDRIGMAFALVESSWLATLRRYGSAIYIGPTAFRQPSHRSLPSECAHNVDPSLERDRSAENRSAGEHRPFCSNAAAPYPLGTYRTREPVI